MPSGIEVRKLFESFGTVTFFGKKYSESALCGTLAGIIAVFEKRLDFLRIMSFNGSSLSFSSELADIADLGLERLTTFNFRGTEWSIGIVAICFFFGLLPFGLVIWNVSSGFNGMIILGEDLLFSSLADVNETPLFI